MNSISGKIAAFVLALFLASYVGYQVYRYFYSPVKTQSVQAYTMQEILYTEGVAIRDETPVPCDADGVLRYLYDDGARVIDTTVVAEVFADIGGVHAVDRIEEIDAELEQLETLSAIADSVTDVSKISGQIGTSLEALRRVQRSGFLQEVPSAKASVVYALNKKQIATKEVLDFSGRIDALTAEKELLQTSAALVTETVSAGAYGYFSSYCDTGWQQISSAGLAQWSVEDFEALIGQEYPEEAGYAGKVIAGYAWHFAVVLPEADAKRFAIGNRLALYFETSVEDRVPAEVYAITWSADGSRAAVVFECDYMSEQLAQMRNLSVRIEVGIYNGLKIPYSALRFSGEEQGVYILYNQRVIFRKVRILYDGLGFIVSAPTAEREYVALYDDVIVKGNNLYDGKILSGD